MSTTTVLKLGVNLMMKSTIFMTNCLTQIGYTIENGRGLGGYMCQNQEWIERGFQTWLGEQKLLSAHFEIYDPSTDKAYERCQIDLHYTTEATEQVVKPPIEQLETLLKKLDKLPPGAQMRVVAMKAPGASAVEGWYPTELKPFISGDTEDIEVGDKEYGFGHTWGKIVYKVVKRFARAQNETQGINL
jgi:hypothetical protein